jgi:hypothetical protein
MTNKSKRAQTHSRLGLERLSAVIASCFVGLSPVLAETTVAVFNFNEGNGLTTRSATNGLTGTLGTPIHPDVLPTLSDGPSGKTGDKALSLQNGGFLVVDDSQSPVLNLLTNAITAEAWVNHSSLDPNPIEGILAYGGSYKMGLMNGEIVWTLYGVVDVMSGLYLPADEWHHIAAAWEPGVGVTFYYDGVPTFVSDAGAMRAFGNNYLTLGGESLSGPIQGSLDRIRIHKGLLTAEELDSVAATPKALLANTLVSYDFSESAAPFQSGKTPARPAISSENYFNNLTAPTFTSDAPTGSSSDYALEFTGNGKRVVVADPDTAVSFVDDNSFTLEAWVKYDILPGARAVLIMNNAPGGAFSFSVTADHKLFVTMLGIVDQPSTASIPNDGGWHHVAVVHDNGKEFRFYVDGILGETVAYVGGVIFTRTDASFSIGAESGGALPYVGKLDRLRITRGVVPAEKLDFRVIPGIDPGAPSLTIRTMVEIGWPTLPAGYKLQTSTNPTDAASWSFSTNTPTASEGMFKYYVQPGGAKSFYRLIKP